MGKERILEPFFKGKGEYQSYFLSFREQRQSVRRHNELQLKSARNERILREGKISGVSRRVARREAKFDARI